MVSHKAVGVTKPVITIVHLVKYLKKQFEVLSALENGFFLIAAGRDMINGARMFYT